MISKHIYTLHRKLIFLLEEYQLVKTPCYVPLKRKLKPKQKTFELHRRATRYWYRAPNHYWLTYWLSYFSWKSLVHLENSNASKRWLCITLFNNLFQYHYEFDRLAYIHFSAWKKFSICFWLSFSSCLSSD